MWALTNYFNPLEVRVRHPYIVRPKSNIWRILRSELFLFLKRPHPQDLEYEKSPSSFLYIFAWLDLSNDFALQFIAHNKAINIHVMDKNSGVTFFDYQARHTYTNLLILVLWSSIIEGPYLDSWVNLNDYYLTLIFHCLRLMNLSTFASLIPRVKNLSGKALLNSPTL